MATTATDVWASTNQLKLVTPPTSGYPQQNHTSSKKNKDSAHIKSSFFFVATLSQKLHVPLQPEDLLQTQVLTSSARTTKYHKKNTSHPLILHHRPDRSNGGLPVMPPRRPPPLPRPPFPTPINLAGPIHTACPLSPPLPFVLAPFPPPFFAALLLLATRG